MSCKAWSCLNSPRITSQRYTMNSSIHSLLGNAVSVGARLDQKEPDHCCKRYHDPWCRCRIKPWHVLRSADVQRRWSVHRRKLCNSSLVRGTWSGAACLMLLTSASLINSSAVAKSMEVRRRLPSNLISRAPRSLSLHIFICIVSASCE